MVGGLAPLDRKLLVHHLLIHVVLVAITQYRIAKRCLAHAFQHLLNEQRLELAGDLAQYGRIVALRGGAHAVILSKFVNGRGHRRA